MSNLKKQTIPATGAGRISNPKSGAIPKTSKKLLMRNVEQKVVKQPKIINHLQCDEEPKAAVSSRPSSLKQLEKELDKFEFFMPQLDHKTNTLNVHPSAIFNRESYNLATPQLLSTLVMGKEINKINSKKPKQIKSLGDLTPCSKSIATEQISQKLNFPAEKSIYKNLCPINVNDVALRIDCDANDERGRRWTRLKNYKFGDKKDPVPVLADYLTPIEPLDVTVNLDDEDWQEFLSLKPSRLKSPDDMFRILDYYESLERRDDF